MVVYCKNRLQGQLLLYCLLVVEMMHKIHHLVSGNVAIFMTSCMICEGLFCLVDIVSIRPSTVLSKEYMVTVLLQSKVTNKCLCFDHSNLVILLQCLYECTFQEKVTSSSCG